MTLATPNYAIFTPQGESIFEGSHQQCLKELDERQEPTSKFYPFDDDYEFGTDHLYHASCDCPACNH